MSNNDHAPGRIITFYSYKGGVGRSMALANIAVLLAHLHKRVLVVDWDLEAPGLDRYLRPYFRGVPERPGGLLRLLESVGLENDDGEIRYRELTHGVDVRGFAGFDLLSSGDDQADYSLRLSGFSWVEFFANKNGANWLERLRDAWLRDYEYVLIDSRTGVTDSGGVCTVKLPDQLVFVLTANQQNVEGCKRVIAGIHHARLQDPSDLARLLILPLLSRYDGRVETDLADEWLERCAELFAPVVADWLEKDVSALKLLRRTKLPHVPRYAFGEELAVMRDSHDDPERLPYYYIAVTQILASDFQVGASLLHGETEAATLRSEEVRQSAIEQQKAAEEVAQLSSHKEQQEQRIAELEHQRMLLAKSQQNRTRAAVFAVVLMVMIGIGVVFAVQRKHVAQLQGSERYLLEKQLTETQAELKRAESTRAAAEANQEATRKELAVLQQERKQLLENTKKLDQDLSATRRMLVEEQESAKKFQAELLKKLELLSPPYNQSNAPAPQRQIQLNVPNQAAPTSVPNSRNRR